jgi:hypothetical protein
MTHQQDGADCYVSISQCNGQGCFDEHMKSKSSKMGASCNLKSVSAYSSFLCLVYVAVYCENPDSHR